MKTSYEFQKIAEAYKKMKEKKLSPEQDAELDVHDDDKIDAKDFAKLRKMKGESSCGKMRKEEVEQVDEAAPNSFVKGMKDGFRDAIHPDHAARYEKRLNRANSMKSIHSLRDKAHAAGHLKPKHAAELEKNKRNYALNPTAKKESVELDEVKYGDTGWKKTKGPRKDQYGNRVKNVAQHLAKKGAKQAQSMNKEEVDLFSDAELQRLIDQGVFESSDREKHYKGATKPETMDDMIKGGNNKEFVKMHDQSDDEFENKIYQSHNDAKKAAGASKQSSGRRGDNLANGDKKIKK